MALYMSPIECVVLGMYNPFDITAEFCIINVNLWCMDSWINIFIFRYSRHQIFILLYVAFVTGFTKP
jgi:hypothetical protein